MNVKNKPTRTAGPICTAVLLALAAASATAQSTTTEPPTEGDLDSPAKQVADPTLTRADADMRRVLEAHQKLGAKPIAQLTPDEARAQPSPADAVKAVMKTQGKPPPRGVKTRDLQYETAGGKQPIRLYVPESRGQAEAGTGAPLPVIVYYHGGGWVIADIDTYESSAIALAKQANAIVASAEYRKGPEHKVPAAHEDAFAAYRWVLDNVQQYGGDPRQVAVAGESAGGNLAANVAIMARDQRVQAPVHMLLVYPVAGTDMNTPSYKEHANAKPLSKAGMQWFAQHALDEKTKQSPMLNLTRANLKGLPPATVITAEIDPLRSEGQQLAKALEKAGVEVAYRNFDGVTHEFFGMDAVVADAKAAQAFAAQQLREDLASARTRSAEAAPTASERSR